jgi:hypothetical protein
MCDIFLFFFFFWHLELSIVEVYMNWTFYHWNLYKFNINNLTHVPTFAKSKQWHIWTLIYAQFTFLPRPKIHKDTHFNISSCWLPRYFLHPVGLQQNQNQNTNLICVLWIFYASTIYVEFKLWFFSLVRIYGTPNSSGLICWFHHSDTYIMFNFNNV